MKKHFVLLLVLLITVLSCRKDRNLDITSLSGSWELTRSYSNGIVYDFTNYPEGNGNTVTFRDDGTFVKTVKGNNGSSTNEYNYHLEKGKFCTHDEPIDTFLYYGDKEPELLRLQNGILYLESTMCVEGGLTAGGNSYRKIN